jgi:hypothetical protein
MKINKWNKKKPTSSSSYGKIDFVLVDSKKEDNFLEVKKAVELMPEWYKDLPGLAYLRENDKKKDLTAKRCIPILDAFTSGYFLVTTEDYVFSKKEDSFSFTGGKNIRSQSISMHPWTQLGDISLSSEFIKYAFKWKNSYLIKTPPGYSCIFTQPMNHFDLPFHTMSGVVDTDTYIMPVLFPFLMKKDFEGVIPKGTPIVQVIPFKRDDWESSIYDTVSPVFKEKENESRREYESGRYIDGEAAGGMYKKHYRKKKRYM